MLYYKEFIIFVASILCTISNMEIFSTKAGFFFFVRIYSGDFSLYKNNKTLSK